MTIRRSGSPVNSYDIAFPVSLDSSSTSSECPTRRDKCGHCVKSVLRSIWSIQMLIIVVLVLAVVGTSCAIWPTNYAFAIRGVNSVAVIARNQTILLALDEINAFIESGPQFAHLLTQIFRDVQVLDVALTVRETIAVLSKAFFSGAPLLAAVGFPDGNIIAIDRFNSVYLNGSSEIVYVSEWNATTLTIENPQYIIPNYRLSARPWYNETFTVCAPIWIQPFTNRLNPPNIVSSFSQPVFAVSGQFLGIMSIELDLNILSVFLQGIPAFNSTRIVLVNETGAIIASSTGVSYQMVNGAPEIIPASQHPDQVIRETAAQIQARTTKSLAIGSFTYGRGRGKRTVVIERVTSTYPLNWYVVENLSDYELLKSVYDANRVNAIVCSVCIVVALIAAVIIGCIIAIPLRTICKELDKASSMDFERERSVHTFKLLETQQIDNSLKRMKRGLSSFAKYVPVSVVKVIVRTKQCDGLGVVPRELSVLFADIKDFTTIAEVVEPKQLVTLLCQFFTRMSEIVTQNGGVVDKYIGDAVMALYNAPDHLDHHEYAAVKSALQMKQDIMDMNIVWTAKYYPRIHIRVGVNSCLCLVGNVGSDKRMAYTALGDGINIAARCESLNKRFGTDILITQTTWEKVNTTFLCRWISYVSLKGKTQSIHVYEAICPVETATSKQKLVCGLHLEAKAALEALDAPQLLRICDELLAIDRTNIAAKELRERVQLYGLSPDNIALVLVEK